MQGNNIQRFFRGNTHTAALPDGKVPETLMLSKDFSFAVDKVSASRRFLNNIIDIAGIKVLAVRFVTDFEPGFLGQFSDFRFGVTAERQHNAGQLFLRQTIKKISLIFTRIFAAKKLITPVFLIKTDTGIMPGRKLVKFYSGRSGGKGQG